MSQQVLSITQINEYIRAMMDSDALLTGLLRFGGANRRFQHKGNIDGITIIDDYAHHPTEIKATLSAAQQMPHNRIRCIFEPHTYSRTRTLWNEFLTAFNDADELILTDIYAARELPDGVTTSEKLAEAIKETGLKVTYIKDFSDIADYIKSTSETEDIVFTMGAGTVTKIGPMLCDNKI